MALTTKPQRSTLSYIPNDILLCIADKLEYSWDLNSFAQVNCSLHAILNRYLYQRNIKEFNSSALNWAAEHGVESTMQKMLDEGAPLNCGQDEESSPDQDPLAIAARSGNNSMVQLLLDRGANPNGNYGFCDTYRIPNTPLSQAILGGNESTARILLDHGAEREFLQDPNDLASAFAYEGSIDGLKFLAEMQCDFEPMVGFHDTPLIQAVRQGNIDVLQYLLEIARVNPNHQPSGTRRSQPAIYHAAEQHNPMVMECLLKNGADMDHSMLHNSPLGLAMTYRCMEAVKVLLKYMDMSKLHKREQYILPCAAAAACGSESSVKNLIDTGCRLDENKSDGGFLFWMECSSRSMAWAAEMGHENVVLQLLSHGADPDAPAEKSYRQTKPLIAAVDGGHLHIINLLLDEGVDPNTFDEDSNYDRPLLTAIRMGRADIVGLLLKHCADPNVQGGPFPHEKALSTAVDEYREEITMLLLDSGADPNTRNRYYEPVLSLAFHHEGIFRQLLERGADPTVNRRDEPLLIQAIKWGKIAQVQMLLDHGDELRVLQREEALLSAGASGGSSMLEFLFQHGLEEPHPESKEAMAMITAAIQGQSPSGLAFLLDRGYRILQGDHFSHIHDSWQYVRDSFEPSEAIIDILLSHGLNINATGRHRRTCLWEAIDDWNTFMLSVFLKRGANPLHRDRDGETPLLHAIRRGRRPNQIMQLIESVSTAHSGLSHDELKREISRAESEAAAQKEWKIVRALQRFYYWDLGCGM